MSKPLLGHVPPSLAEQVRRMPHGHGHDIYAPTSDDVTVLCKHLKAHPYGAALPLEQRLRAVARVAERLLDRQTPERRMLEEMLPQWCGYDAEMIRLGLTRYLKGFRAHALRRFVAGSFADGRILDAFVPDAKGGFTRAVGVGLSCHLWAGNVPGVGLWSLVSAVLAGSPYIGKLAADEPLVCSVFAQLLAEVEPSLADRMAVVYWQGEDATVRRAALAESDAVLCYGSAETIASVHADVPSTARFYPFGHKLSCHIIGRESMDRVKLSQTLHAVAKDIVYYDQAGCYSSRIVFVEDGEHPNGAQFAKMLSETLRAYGVRYPRHTDAGQATRNAHRQKEAALQAALHPEDAYFGDATSFGAVYFQNTEGGVVLQDLQRQVTVVPFKSLEALAPFLSQAGTLLQTVGISVGTERLFNWSDFLAGHGINRICAIGEMTHPAPGWHHDGWPSVAILVNYVNLEESAVHAADIYSAATD